MLADVHCQGDKLLCVGADYLLHHGGQVFILRVPDDRKKLQGDLPDLWLQILLGQVAFVTERHLEGDGCLNFDGWLLVVKEAVYGQPEEMEI